MKKNFLIVFIVLFFFSCQKEISKEVSSANTNPQVDVYVAGFVSDLSAGIPAYWKNGRLVLIDRRMCMWQGAMGLQPCTGKTETR